MKELEIKTKIGSRIRITSIPFGITNLSEGIKGVTIAAPEIINDFVQVRIQLDDSRIITWKEGNLEVVEDAPPTEEVKKTEIDLINRDGKTYALVKDLRKHPLNDKIYLKCRKRTPVKNEGGLKLRSSCAQCFSGEMNSDQKKTRSILIFSEMIDFRHKL